MTSQIRVDDASWPMVVVTYGDAVDTSDVEAAFARYAELCVRGRHAYLIDFRSFNPATAPASNRRRAAELFEKHRVALLAATICEARVVEGALARGILTAFDWLTGTKWPVMNTKRYAEAETWVRARLHAAGLAAPP